MQSLSSLVKYLFRACGLEVRRYTVDTSERCRIKRLLEHHGIDLVLDVGANTGQYGMFLRELDYRGMIVSFEPLSSAHEQLIKRSRNDPDWIIAPRMAIGDNSGEITLHISGNSQSSSVLNMLDAHSNAAPDSAYIGDQRVPLHRLDDIAGSYVANSSAAYLKIDVQGYESQVLEGSEHILPMIKGIQLELSLVPLYENQVLYREMIDKLDGLGYVLHALFPVFSDVQSGRLLQMDGIFFRK